MAVRTRPCARCGGEIAAERIEVLPETRLCLKCSEEVGGEFEVTITPENLAKAGSMKKNYGSFAVKKSRKPVRRKDA
jgi:reverse gyrase